jgi:hypothetical protein
MTLRLERGPGPGFRVGVGAGPCPVGPVDLPPDRLMKPPRLT